MVNTAPYKANATVSDGCEPVGVAKERPHALSRSQTLTVRYEKGSPAPRLPPLGDEACHTAHVNDAPRGSRWMVTRTRGRCRPDHAAQTAGGPHRGGKRGGNSTPGRVLTYPPRPARGAAPVAALDRDEAAIGSPAAILSGRPRQRSPRVTEGDSGRDAVIPRSLRRAAGRGGSGTAAWRPIHSGNPKPIRMGDRRKLRRPDHRQPAPPQPDRVLRNLISCHELLWMLGSGIS
jgi:hypothetical protein